MLRLARQLLCFMCSASPGADACPRAVAQRRKRLHSRPTRRRPRSLHTRRRLRRSRPIRRRPRRRPTRRRPPRRRTRRRRRSRRTRRRPRRSSRSTRLRLSSRSSTTRPPRPRTRSRSSSQARRLLRALCDGCASGACFWRQSPGAFTRHAFSAARPQPDRMPVASRPAVCTASSGLERLPPDNFTDRRQSVCVRGCSGAVPTGAGGARAAAGGRACRTDGGRAAVGLRAAVLSGCEMGDDRCWRPRDKRGAAVTWAVCWLHMRKWQALRSVHTAWVLL